MTKELVREYIDASLEKGLAKARQVVLQNEKERIIMTYGDLNEKKLTLILAEQKKELVRCRDKEKYQWLVYITHELITGAAFSLALQKTLSLDLRIDIENILAATGPSDQPDSSYCIDFAVKLDKSLTDKDCQVLTDKDYQEYFEKQHWLLKIQNESWRGSKTPPIKCFKHLTDEWTTLLNQMISFIDGIVPTGNQQIIASLKTKYSFTWLGSNQELETLYNKLKDNNLISSETSQANFNAVFQRKPLESITPIKWGQSKILLAYFINKLSLSNSTISAADNHWKIAEACFEQATNLKQANQNWQSFGEPKNHKLIDGLF